MKIKNLNDLKVLAFKAAVIYSKMNTDNEACQEIAAELGMKLADLQQHSSCIYEPFSIGSADSLHLANFVGRLRKKIICANEDASCSNTKGCISEFNFEIDAKKELDRIFAIFQFACCYADNIARMFMLLHAPTFIKMMNKIDPQLDCDSSSEGGKLNYDELCRLSKYLDIKEIKESPYEMDQTQLKDDLRKALLKLHPDKGGDTEEFKKFNGLHKRWIANKTCGMEKLNLRKNALEIQQLFYEIYNENLSSALKSFGTDSSDDFKLCSQRFMSEINSNIEMKKIIPCSHLPRLDQSIEGHTSLLQKRIQYNRKKFFIISFINWSSLFASAMLFNNPSSQGLLSATTSLSDQSSLCGFGGIAAAHLLSFAAQRFFEEKSEICRNLDHYLIAPPIAINLAVVAISVKVMIENAVNRGSIECHPGVKLMSSSLAASTAVFLYWQYKDVIKVPDKLPKYHPDDMRNGLWNLAKKKHGDGVKNQR